MKERIIFHIDVNNAFLSWTAVDMLKHGSKIDIRKRYSVISGSEEERRGVVLAKSPLAKKKGICSAESLYVARKKCPYLEVYKPDFNIYKEESRKLFKYLSKYSPLIEVYSIDECFMDYTECQKLFGPPLELAEKIKSDIEHNFGWTVNIGIANNKLCAKMASDFEKPNKIHTLFNYEIENKLWPLDVGDLFMIGKKTTIKLKEMGINTIYDLAHTDIKRLELNFKSMSKMMYEYSNGIDESPVETEWSDPKSISSSTVLPYNYTNIDSINNVMRNLSMEVGRRLRKYNFHASTICVQIKYASFNKISKQYKLNNSINTDNELYEESMKLFNKIWNEDPIRQLGISVSNLDNVGKVQLSIFDSQSKKENEDNLQKTIDILRSKYGDNKIIYGDMIKNNNNERR